MAEGTRRIKKSARILREVEAYLRDPPIGGGRGGRTRGQDDLFWPGGAGGGGRRRSRSRAGAVVKPHARTSAHCKRCGQFHTTAEHRRHGVPAPARAKKTRAKKGTSPRGRATSAKKRRRGSRATARTAAPVGRPDDARALALVLGAASQIRGRGRVGDQVFVSEVYRRVGRDLGMTLPEFKAWLVEQNRQQHLALARMDLVDMVPERLVSDSEIQHLNAEFHLIHDPSHRNSYF